MLKSSENRKGPQTTMNKFRSLFGLIVILFVVILLAYTMVLGDFEKYQDLSRQSLQRIANLISRGKTMKNPPKPSDFRYWGNFLMWDRYKRPDYGPDVSDKTDRYFIYRCDGGKMSVCGGWADRLKGMVISYLLANLTDRVFKAQIFNPDCDLTNYIVPNRVDWEDLSKKFPNENEYRIYRHVDDHGFKSHMHELNFSKEFDINTKFVYFLGNLEDVTNLMQNKIYSQELSWMHNLTSADVYAAVYKRLFKLHPRLQTRLNSLLSKTLKTQKDRLICIHVRMGKTKTIQYDTETRNNVTNLPKIWDFVNNHSKSEYDKVYVMSDSEEVITSARNQKFKDRLVTVPGSIVHVDKQYGTSTQTMCEGFEKLLLEHHMLMNCDLLVRGHSGLSMFASFIRGTDKDLYCLHDNGDIAPCVRNNFRTFL